MLLSAIKYFVSYFMTLFAVMGPMVVLPLFFSMTATYTKEEKHHLAKKSCLVALSAMIFFALTGKMIFGLFGITIGSFCIAGGIFIMLIGLDMLRSTPSMDNSSDNSDVKVKKSHEDISVTPFGIPLICGAGCITNITIFQAQATNTLEQGLGLVAIILNIVLLYGSFLIAVRGSSFLKPSILVLCSKLAGLVLMALAVEFMVKGIKSPELGLWISEEKTVMISNELPINDKQYFVNEIMDTVENSVDAANSSNE